MGRMPATVMTIDDDGGDGDDGGDSDDGDDDGDGDSDDGDGDEGGVGSCTHERLELRLGDRDVWLGAGRSQLRAFCAVQVIRPPSQSWTIGRIPLWWLLGSW